MNLPNPKLKGGTLVTTPDGYKTCVTSTLWKGGVVHHLCLVPRKTIVVDGKEREQLHPKCFPEESLVVR